MVGESKLHHSNPGTWFVVTYLGVCGCFPEFLERAPWCTLGCRRKGCMGCARVVQLGLCRLLVGELSAELFQPSLKGHSESQTASTHIQELSIRYVRAFGASLFHFSSFTYTHFDYTSRYVGSVQPIGRHKANHVICAATALHWIAAASHKHN